MTVAVDRASGPKIDAGGRPRRAHEPCRKNLEKQIQDEKKAADKKPAAAGDQKKN